MKWRAPYSGMLHLNTYMNLSKGIGMHESNHGWTASQGPKGGPKSGGDATAIALRCNSTLRFNGVMSLMGIKVRRISMSEMKPSLRNV